MKVVVFCVRDIKANVYGNPFFLQSTGAAIRQFTDEVNRADENNLLYKHPEDFELYQFGVFDTLTATWELSEPMQIAVGSSCAVKAPVLKAV